MGGRQELRLARQTATQGPGGKTGVALKFQCLQRAPAADERARILLPGRSGGGDNLGEEPCRGDKASPARRKAITRWIFMAEESRGRIRSKSPCGLRSRNGSFAGPDFPK